MAIKKIVILAFQSRLYHNQLAISVRYGIEQAPAKITSIR